jgi:aspartate-semialdehyde dehydrogenase
MSGALRLGVVGATGTLGRDLIGVLEEAALGLAELRAIAGERSLGEDVEFAGENLSVQSGEFDLAGLDAVILCTPPAVSLELIRHALRVEVPCIDCSGALLASSEVPLVMADLGAHDGVSAAPLIASPTGATLVWAPVLSALQREAGLVRVVGTVLHSASSEGHAGISALSEQTLALIGQQETIETGPIAGPLAFSSVPHAGADSEEKDGAALSESQLRTSLHRLLGREVAVSSSSVYVPSFAGQGGALFVETERPVLVGRAATVLAASPGVEVMAENEDVSTRDAVGCDTIRVARLRVDTSDPGSGSNLMFWLAADPVRLAAINAVKLLRARFSLG